MKIIKDWKKVKIWFCKRFSHASGIPHSPYMPGNWEFIAYGSLMNF
jgi:hypothetical protein